MSNRLNFGLKLFIRSWRMVDYEKINWDRYHKKLAKDIAVFERTSINPTIDDVSFNQWIQCDCLGYLNSLIFRLWLYLVKEYSKEKREFQRIRDDNLSKVQKKLKSFKVNNSLFFDVYQCFHLLTWNFADEMGYSYH